MHWKLARICAPNPFSESTCPVMVSPDTLVTSGKEALDGDLRFCFTTSWQATMAAHDLSDPDEFPDAPAIAAMMPPTTKMPMIERQPIPAQPRPPFFWTALGAAPEIEAGVSSRDADSEFGIVFSVQALPSHYRFLL